MAAKSTIPAKLREELTESPEYSRCCLQGTHECQGRITWEHALYYAGKKINERFSILPLCALGHGVDLYQDMASVTKEVRVWVALNRATDDELWQYPRTVPSFFFQRDRLNAKYGTYKAPPIPERASVVAQSPLREVRKPVSTKGPNSELEREARSYARINGCSLEEATDLITSLV